MPDILTHVFIIHTQFQELVCQKIIDKLKSEKGEAEKFYAVYEGLEPTLIDLWDERLIVDSCRGTVRHLRKSVVKEVSHFIERKCHRKTRVYVSDCAWPLNNILFSQFSERDWFCFSLFMDGALIYFDPEVTKLQYLRGVAKGAYSLIKCGYIYRQMWGSTIGWQSRRIDEVWGARLDLTDVPDKKIRSISFKKPFEKQTENRSGTLFLDQPLHNSFKNKTGAELSELVIDKIKKTFPPPYFYKRHHFQDQDVDHVFCHHEFILIDEKNNVESLKILEEVEVVVGISTTALITAKLIFDEQVSCFHLLNLVNGILIPKDLGSKISKIFSGLGISPIR